MPRPLLSACLIVRNEERFLERCLLSVRPVVDEMVVVDTGSTDRTGAIAAECGARLHHGRWSGDFAAARNHALDLARGEWILYIDADERARSCSPSQLRALLSDRAHVGYYVLFHPRPRFTPYWELRLFRNDPRIRFRGIIHENIWPGINAYRAAKRGKIGHSPLVLDHEGYEEDQHAKHLRNLPLLRRALRRDPGGVFNWCHLASIYLALGKESRAEAAWKTALGVVRTKRRVGAEDSLPYIGLIEWGASRGRDVGSLLQEALDRFPENLQLRWLRGKALMRAGRFEDAITVFRGLVACGETGNWDHSVAYDSGLFDVLAYAQLATCHFRLGEHGESRRYFELAAKHDPHSLEYRVKLALCSRLLAAAGTRRNRPRPRAP